MPNAVEARQWLARWDRQQEYYMPDREERFTVIADVVAASAERPNPLILDLGTGPGSLAVRLVERLPAAQVVAVDADPLLLGLARAAHGERRNIRFVEADLRQSDWVHALRLCRRPDAIVSTTALHWLTEPELAAVYRHCAGLLPGDGVFVNGDQLDEPAPVRRLAALQQQVHETRTARAGVREHEDWEQWWRAVAAAPELADLTGDRAVRPVDHDVAEPVSYVTHVRLLCEAGFGEVGTVWQHGPDRVIVGVR